MLFIGGAKGSHLAAVLAVLAVGAVLVFTVFPLLGFDYVSDRLLSFRDPEADIQHATYQTYQSLIALGSGGMFGQGLGNSHQKYSYLPFAENDFIFSVIVEELGFVGAVVVILLFLILIVRGFYIAASAPDKEGMLLCAGIVIQIGFQAFLNIAVASNAFFNTGVSLPFLSYGGTALMMQLGEMGVVLNISRKASI
jgi:cell division protein FtsW